MAALRCPGQDPQHWSFEDIFESPCPHCRTHIEFWKDEPVRPCRRCGMDVPNPRLDRGCAQWCRHADECLGNATASPPDPKAE